MKALFRNLVFGWLVLTGTAVYAAEDVLLTRFLPGVEMAQASERIKRAIGAHNYTFVREQVIDAALVPSDWAARSVKIVYFCNFDRLDAALRRDARTTQLMPCRITLIERGEGVDLVAVNPAWVTEQWNAPELHEQCQSLKRDYLSILEEVAL